MTVPRFLFIDDTTGVDSDGERFCQLLNKDGELRVELRAPDRDRQLAGENELEPGVDGFILDINLSDQAGIDGKRFAGTGAGLAQDLRLQQALYPDGGQRPRPIIRLCAEQVFQHYLEGDNSTVDIFDLGFSKETIGDIASEARKQIAALSELYLSVIAVAGDLSRAASFLGLTDDLYLKLHSRFRSALEREFSRKPHEAASFLVRQFLLPPGPLVAEELLAVRLGVDIESSPGWPAVLEALAGATYNGVAAAGFPRWWWSQVSGFWAAKSKVPAHKLRNEERVDLLGQHGFSNLAPLKATANSPGDRPWDISVASDLALRLPVDPAFSLPIVKPLAPWLDEPVWCLEQGKRNRNSPYLAAETREKLRALLKQLGNANV